MTQEQFNAVVLDISNYSDALLLKKNAGYATACDPLHNFNLGADFINGTPAQAAWGYMTKHLVALQDKINRNDFSDLEDFREKCTDILNYVKIIYAIGVDNTLKEAEHDVK